MWMTTELRREVETRLALAKRQQDKHDLRDYDQRMIVNEGYKYAMLAVEAYVGETLTPPQRFFEEYGLKRNYLDFLRDCVETYDNSILNNFVKAYNEAREQQDHLDEFDLLPYDPPKSLEHAAHQANLKLIKVFQRYFHDKRPVALSLDNIEVILVYELDQEPDPVDEKQQLRTEAEKIINLVYPVACSYWNPDYGRWQVFYDAWHGKGQIEYVFIDKLDDAWTFVMAEIGDGGEGFTKEGWRKIFSRVSLESFNRLWRKHGQDEVLLKAIHERMA